MTASRAVLYCTVNGVCNNTNGLGRQTKTLLSALARHHEELIRFRGPFNVHVACPQSGPNTWTLGLIYPYDSRSPRFTEDKQNFLKHETSSLILSCAGFWCC